MKNIRCMPLCCVLALPLCSVTIRAQALPLLPFPTAANLSRFAFIQPFAGLAVVSESGGIGQTESFFSDLPDGAFSRFGNRVTDILGNFQAFDPAGNTVPFTADTIVGVEVTDLGPGPSVVQRGSAAVSPRYLARRWEHRTTALLSKNPATLFVQIPVRVASPTAAKSPDPGATFTPAFGRFDFAGKPSVTFTDIVNPANIVTFSAGDVTLAFTFVSNFALDYSFRLLTTGLPVGSFLSFGGAEPPPIPEPTTLLLVGSGFAVLLGWRLRQRHHKTSSRVVTADGRERQDS